MVVRLVHLECGHERLVSEGTFSVLPTQAGENFILLSEDIDMVCSQPYLVSSNGRRILGRVNQQTEQKLSNGTSYLRIVTKNSVLSLIVVAVLNI